MEERTCYACGKTKSLTSKYWKKTKNGYTQKCKACIYKKTKELRTKRLMDEYKKCPSCGEWRKGRDFPMGAGNRICFICKPEGKESKIPKTRNIEGGILSDEELEKRYQRMVNYKSFTPIIEKPVTKIGDKIKIIREKPEDKFALFKETRGKVVGQTKEFIVLERASGVRECFRYIDIAIGEYRIEGV